MIRFFLVLVVCALSLAGIMFMARELEWIAAFPSFFYQTVIFLTFSTGLLYRYLFKVEKPEHFVQLYLLTMAVKILAYGTYCVAILLKDPIGAKANIVFFLITYFIFTALEIAFLYHKINKPNTA